MMNNDSNNGGDSDDAKPKTRIPGEGDVISGGGLRNGTKFVVDSCEEEIPGILTVSFRELSPDGSYDPSSSKKKEASIVINKENVLDVEDLKFHNKMKKKFVKKNEV